MEILSRLSNWIVNIKSGDIPKEAIERAKDAILDTTGVTLAGAKEESGRIITKFIKEVGGEKVSTVIGHSFKNLTPKCSACERNNGACFRF